MKKRAHRLFRENKGFLIFLLLMFMFRSAVADWNSVPTGSMKPTILEGDRIWVNKMAYDVRLPFSHFSLIKIADPARGDIVVFDSATADKRLVKRVVGLPNDVVALRDNKLYINGERLPTEAAVLNGISKELTENLLGVEHGIKLSPQGSSLSSFGPVRVPVNMYFVLGDNRDNSVDSRVIGFVPRNEIVGRSRSVVMSLNYDQYYLPRAERFFKSL